MLSPKIELLLVGRQVSVNREHLDRGLDESWKLETWLPGEAPKRLAQLAAAADMIICGYDAVDAGHIQDTLPKAKTLKLLQIPFRGFDWLRFGDLPEGCIVCNSTGHEVAIAEYVFAGLLDWEKRIGAIDRSFRGGTWTAGGFGMKFPQQGELYGKTIGIIGYGLIGEEVAKRANAFGMRNIAVGRREREAPPGLDWYGLIDRLPDLLRQSDYIVVACTLNEDTKGLLNAERLALCQSHAVIINVARGPVIEEAALFHSLKSKQIAGAILDVWYNYPDMSQKRTASDSEPRPSDFPYHELDNVIMTPHCSARTNKTQDRVWDSVVDNLLRFARGEDLRNIVYDGRDTHGR